MQSILSEQHRERYAEFEEFVARNVEGCADSWDREERVPDEVIAALGSAGYLGCCVPAEHGGAGLDTVTFGLLNEAMGHGSASLTDLLTVQAMVSMTLAKWGSAEQKRSWLPRLARGDVIGAFAMTEPEGGSALDTIATELSRAGAGDGFVLNGRKKWISFADRAGVFVVFGKIEDLSVACLVPSDARGVHVEPISGLLGFRAAGLGEVCFEDAPVPKSDVIGKPGFALSHVAPVGLKYGRISTACSALGLARACFEQSVAHAATRRVGDRSVGEFGMIRSMLARMRTDIEAGLLLCLSACRAEDDHLPEAFERTLMAKYFTSTAAVRAAADAVQIRGASGCHDSSPVGRFYRDAKVTEIIEGTTQIHEDLLGSMLVGRAVGFDR